MNQHWQYNFTWINYVGFKLILPEILMWLWSKLECFQQQKPFKDKKFQSLFNERAKSQWRALIVMSQDSSSVIWHRQSQHKQLPG